LELLLSLRERFLLETWLPRESPSHDARSLVATGQDLTPDEASDRLSKVRTHLAELRSERSMLDVAPPLGRGVLMRQPGGVELRYLSTWEGTWLLVDRMSARGQFDAPRLAIQELAESLSTPFLNALAKVLLCVETASEAVRIANALSSELQDPRGDAAWVRWLAGGETSNLGESLGEALIGETPKRALLAALQDRWPLVLELLPKEFQKPFAKPVKPSGTRMHGQFLAQLASHVVRGEPSRDVLDASLTTLFSFFGFDANSPWWQGDEVVTRLPLLALYARRFEARLTGAELLHSQRRSNPHLMEPPSRTFVGPPEVVAALEKLETMLEVAVTQRMRLRGQLTEGGNIFRLEERHS
jgi:hypothetical protein